MSKVTITVKQDDNVKTFNVDAFLLVMDDAEDYKFFCKCSNTFMAFAIAITQHALMQKMSKERQDV